MRPRSLSQLLSALWPLLLASFLSLASASALGYPVVVRVSGHVTHPYAGAQVGDLLTGEFWSDTESAIPGYESSHPLTNWQLTHNGTTTIRPEDTSYEVITVFNHPSEDALQVTVQSQGFMYKFVLEGLASTTFSSGAIPVGFALDTHDYAYMVYDKQGVASFDGVLDSLTITPEPTALALLVVGCGFLLRRSSRRRLP